MDNRYGDRVSVSRLLALIAAGHNWNPIQSNVWLSYCVLTYLPSQSTLKWKCKEWLLATEVGMSLVCSCVRVNLDSRVAEYTALRNLYQLCNVQSGYEPKQFARLPENSCSSREFLQLHRRQSAEIGVEGGVMRREASMKQFVYVLCQKKNKDSHESLLDTKIWLIVCTTS